MPSFRNRAKVWDEETPDDELVLLAQQGHREAFGVIYDRYQTPVFGYCYRMIGQREAAEDANSSVFFKALAALPGYQRNRGTGSFRRWLFAIAHNVIVDALRQQREARSIDDVEWLTASGPTVEEIAIAADERRQVLNLLPHLTVDQRHVFALRLNGFNAAEISEILGRPRNAIDGLHFRAVTKLQELVATCSGSSVAGGRGHD